MGILGNVETTRHGSFFSDNQDFAKTYGPNVSKHELHTKKTFDMDANPDYKHDLKDKIDAFGPDRAVWQQLHHSTRHHWQMFEGDVGKHFVSHLKSQGYDSAKFKEYVDDNDGNEKSGTTHVVFHPKHIKNIE
jgi:hypothetical protein